DPGRPEHGEQAARALADGLVVRASQLPELLLPADQGRLDLTPERCLRAQAEQAPGGDRGCLSLQIEWPGRLDLDRTANERASRIRDQDLAALRGLLESSRDVHGVAAREHTSRADCHLARVDPGPDSEPNAVGELELVVHGV